MPTLKDVAALAGVSAATVSLYLNGKSAGRISQQKQKEIEEKAKAEKEANEQAKQEQKEKNIINTGISILGSIWR